MQRVFLLFTLLISISITYTNEVTWMPNKSFNIAMNFKDGKLPCPKQTVVFPESVWEAVKIDSSISISGLVLPKNGDIIIEDSGAIYFGADVNSNCTDEGNVYYMPRMKSSWADADVWSSPRFNEATPDAERLPCYNDDVIFPQGSQFTVFLPRATQYVKSIYLDGKYFNTYGLELFVKFANRQHLEQQLILNEDWRTGIVVEDKGCQDPFGCPCQKYSLTIDCSGKFCPTPKCQDPIQPVGHCCKICGGLLKTDIGVGFDMLAFQEAVAEVIESYGKGILVHHVGIIPNKQVQVIVVDKGEYNGQSVSAILYIESKISGRGFQSVALYSGAPLSKTGLGGKIAISMFFVAVFVIGAIYVYYYKLPKLPEFRFPTFSRSSRGVISRFHRRTESVVSLTSRRDSTATLRSSAGIGTAFRNPLYDSKRGRVEIAESVAEEE